jgi:hypothetical protein
MREEARTMDYREDIGYETNMMTMGRDELKPMDDLLAYLREYSRERPEVVALSCFAVGFILGWKLKPW